MNISQCKNIKYLIFVGSQVEECILGTSDTAITVKEQLLSMINTFWNAALCKCYLIEYFITNKFSISKAKWIDM